MPWLIVWLIEVLGALIGRWAIWTSLRALLVRLGSYLGKEVFIPLIVKLIKQLFLIATGTLAAALWEQETIKQALIDNILEHTGLELDGFTKEDMKRAIGKKLAQDLNAYYGTTFDSLYPIDTMIQEIKGQIISELLNAVSVNLPPPTSFKFMTNTVAIDIANQIVNRYRVLHNLPAIGVGVVLPSTIKRVQNKSQQATFRASHERLAYWKNNTNNVIFDAFKYKLNAVRIAKRADAYAFNQWQKAITINSTTVAAKEIIYNEKHAILLAAQQLNYTGDGTTL